LKHQIASLLSTVAALPFGHLLVYGFYPAIWLAFLCVSLTVGIYSLTLHMRKRAAGLLQHKFETACTMMSRGSATYMRSIIAQRLLRRYFTTFKQIWREKFCGKNKVIWPRRKMKWIRGIPILQSVESQPQVI